MSMTFFKLAPVALFAVLLLAGFGCVPQNIPVEPDNIADQTSGVSNTLEGTTNQPTDTQPTDTSTETGTQTNTQTGDTQTKGNQPIDTTTTFTSGAYTDYSTDKLALAKNGHVVLFFYAPWCPTCQAANQSFMSNVIPTGLTILKVDYDSATELKKKYGVTYQHTFVQVDENGNMISKWSGSTTVIEITNQVQ